MAIELQEGGENHLDFPLERFDILVPDAKLRHVILFPSLTSGNKVHQGYIQSIANETKEIHDKHLGSQTEFMDRVHDSLAAQGHKGAMYIRHYESARESHERQTRAIVILPLRDTASSFVFPDAEVQKEFNKLLDTSNEVEKLEYERKKISQIAKEMGFDAGFDSELLSQIDSASEFISQQRIQKLREQMNQIKQTYVDGCKGAGMVTASVAQLKMEAKHPHLEGSSVVSVVSDEWGKLFSDNAEIKGANLLSLLDRISSLDLRPLSVSEMHKIVLATMCEMALEQTMEIDPSHPEVAKRKHRIVYVFLPVNINSQEIQDLLASYFVKHFPNLQALNSAYNAPKEKKNTGIFNVLKR